MELPSIELEPEQNFNNEPLTDEEMKKIVMMALISVVSEKYDYSSGPDFPNIPFGD